MDALCFLRVLRMGFLIALVGTWNSLWLFFVYVTAPSSPETEFITDLITKVTIINVPPGSIRLISTAIASYTLFGYVMYLIVKEFEWYTEKRHLFLRRPVARNYTVFCRNIPEEYRNNEALKAFFAQSLSQSSVIQANICVDAPTLAKIVAKREAVINKLERSIYVHRKTGKKVRHTTSFIGEKVDSVSFYAEALTELNIEICRRIEDIENTNQAEDVWAREVAGDIDFDMESTSDDQITPADEEMQDISLKDDEDETVLVSHTLSSGNFVDHDDVDNRRGLIGHFASSVTNGRNNDSAVTEIKKEYASFYKDITSVHSSSANEIAEKAAQSASNAARMAAATAAFSAKTLFLGGTDGELMSAGFVSFTKLNAAQTASQIVQCSRPFEMEVTEAPDPQDSKCRTVSVIIERHDNCLIPASTYPTQSCGQTLAVLTKTYNLVSYSV